MKKQEVDINININVQNNRKGIEPAVNNLRAPNSEKIKSTLSVSQLAFLYRLMYDAKAISLSNQTDILKFISENFQTANAPDISVRSLRSKYYSVDLATKESLKALLHKITSLIDSY